MYSNYVHRQMCVCVCACAHVMTPFSKLDTDQFGVLVRL